MKNFMLWDWIIFDPVFDDFYVSAHSRAEN